MSDDPYADRDRLTFEQAERAEPLPTQLRTKELSQQLRSRLWRVVYQYLRDNTEASSMGEEPWFAKRWKSILYNYYTLHRHMMADEFTNNARAITLSLKTLFSGGSYIHVFGFLQFVLRESNCPNDFSGAIDWALRGGYAAYRVLEGKTIVPISSEAELHTLQCASRILPPPNFVALGVIFTPRVLALPREIMQRACERAFIPLNQWPERLHLRAS
jgi:hypothetical protein